MNYKKLLKKIAHKENISVKELEREMSAALKAAGETCSVKEFIEKTSEIVKNRLYIV